MPAAAVIPALVAYTKFVEVKRLAVECLLKSADGSRRWVPRCGACVRISYSRVVFPSYQYPLAR